MSDRHIFTYLIILCMGCLLFLPMPPTAWYLLMAAGMCLAYLAITSED